MLGEHHNFSKLLTAFLKKHLPKGTEKEFHNAYKMVNAPWSAIQYLERIPITDFDKFTFTEENSKWLRDDCPRLKDLPGIKARIVLQLIYDECDC